MNAIGARFTSAVLDTSEESNQVSAAHSNQGTQDPAGSVFALMIEMQRLLNKDFKQDRQMIRQDQAQQEHAGTNEVAKAASDGWKFLKLR